jgi:hypothetical protein
VSRRRSQPAQVSRRKDDALTIAEVRTVLLDYIAQHQLAYAADAKYVKPDATLLAAVARKGEEESDLEALARQEIIDRLLEGMQRHHRLDRPGHDPALRLVDRLGCTREETDGSAQERRRDSDRGRRQATAGQEGRHRCATPS